MPTLGPRTALRPAHRFFLHVTTAVAVSVVVACSDEPAPSAPQNPDPEEPNPLALLDCERNGYPCSFADVDPAVIEASFDLGSEVLDRLTMDGGEATLGWLAEQSSVVYATGSDRSIRFRLEGGRPHWVLAPSAIGSLTPTVQGQARTPPPAGVVAGEDTNQDGKVNNLDVKRALILDPFQWDWGAEEFGGAYEEGTAIRSRFFTSRDYAESDAVVYLRNEEVSWERFLDWDQYDVVHVSTHGARECDNFTGELEECHVGLATGIRADGVVDPSNLPGGIDAMTVPSVSDGGEYRYFSISDDFLFFQGNYDAGALDRTLVFWNGCETTALVGEETQIPGGLAHILGSNAAALGWTRPVWVAGAQEAAWFLYDQMLTHGLTIDSAYAKLRSTGGHTMTNSDGDITELLLHRSPADLRIRESVALLESTDAVDLLWSGESLPRLVDGVPNDGQADDLALAVLVEGLAEAQLIQAELSFELDGSPLGPPISLATASVIRSLDPESRPYGWVIGQIVPTGTDLDAGSLYDLEAILELPEGGTSRHEARDLSPRSCEATVDLGGTSAVTRSLRFFLNADRTGVQAFDWKPDDGLGQVTVGFGTDPGNPEVIPFGITGEFDGGTSGLLGGKFFANPGDPDLEPIAPLTVIVSENSGSVFAGTVSGPVWVQLAPDPVVETLTMTFQIEEDPILSSESVKMCEAKIPD